LKGFITIPVLMATMGLWSIGKSPMEAQTVASSPQPLVLPMHGVKKPKLVHQDNPVNPRHAGGRDTRVVVGYVVGVDGHTHDIHIVKSRDSRFNRNAMITVAYFRYRPATQNGIPVPVVVKKNVDFIFPFSEGPEPFIPVGSIQY
jgi:TonB family protein